jgi:hypothetical protein
MKLAYGFYESLSRAEYEQVDALNFSRLKYMERSPMAFRHHCDNPSEPTAPMILGNAAHRAILEPHMKDFAVWPGPGRRFGREWDLFCAENDGKILLNEKEHGYVIGMTEAVHANPLTRKYLRFGKSELTMVWRDLTFKRDFKARIDRLIEIDGEPYLVGLKSTADCRDFRFGANAFKLAYYVQDAIYQNGYFYLTGTLPQVVIVAVESKRPHESAVYRVPNDVLRQGQADLAKWMGRLAECEKTNKWPPAVEDEQDLVLPSYAYPGGDFDMNDLEPVAR